MEQPTEHAQETGRFTGYRGHWPSLDAYAEAFAEDFGVTERLERLIPRDLRPFVRLDAVAFARAVGALDDVTVVPDATGVRIYDPPGRAND